MISQDTEFVNPFVAKETLIMAFISLTMLLGTFLRQMNKKYGIPYNPTLLFLGMFLGYNCEWYNSIFFEAAIKRVSHINAVIFYFAIYFAIYFILEFIKQHGILQIFIPVMVFEAAFNMDWYIFKKQISQIGILAFPCVLINAIIMQILIKVFFYTDDVINITYF